VKKRDYVVLQVLALTRGDAQLQLVTGSLAFDGLLRSSTSHHVLSLRPNCSRFRPHCWSSILDRPFHVHRPAQERSRLVRELRSCPMPPSSPGPDPLLLPAIY
jgi:hypothetical protein